MTVWFEIEGTSFFPEINIEIEIFETENFVLLNNLYIQEMVIFKGR